MTEKRIVIYQTDIYLSIAYNKVFPHNGFLLVIISDKLRRTLLFKEVKSFIEMKMCLHNRPQKAGFALQKETHSCNTVQHHTEKERSVKAFGRGFFSNIKRLLRKLR